MSSAQIASTSRSSSTCSAAAAGAASVLYGTRAEKAKRSTALEAKRRSEVLSSPPFASRCSARRSASSSNSSALAATAASEKRAEYAARRSSRSSRFGTGRAKPASPPPADSAIDGTIGRPAKSPPLVTNASWTASGDESTTHGSLPNWTVMTSPCVCASVTRRRCGGGASAGTTLPRPTVGSAPITGNAVGPGAVGSVTAAAAATAAACMVQRNYFGYPVCTMNGSWKTTTRRPPRA